VDVNLRLNYKVGSLLDMTGKAGLLTRALTSALLVVATVASATAQGNGNGAMRLTGLRTLPGDRIAVTVAREPELTDTVLVTENGEAAFAKLGVIRVDTLTIRQLQRTLLERYSKYLVNPAIEISVLRRIGVIGEVRGPNMYLVDVTTPLRGLIARAGGLTNEANRKKVYIVRDGERIQVKDWERDTGPAADLRSGDQVLVGRKNWLVINALPAVSTAVSVTFLVIAIQNSKQ
jgi:protein involved in polysaccharide export with SLBB domain